MPEAVSSVSSDTPQSNAVDPDTFVLNFVLTKVFQEMLKKPDPDDDSESSTGASNLINREVASVMAQTVTGFGL